MLAVPYMSPQEFADSFVDVDLSKYLPQGTSPNNSAPLMALLRRSSSLADQWCKQVLRATVDSDMTSMYPTKYGTIQIWPIYRPVVSVASIQYQYGDDGWNTIDLTNGLTIYPAYFEYDGQRFHRSMKLSIQYSYVNGFPISTIVGAVNKGAVSFVMKDATGVVAGNTLTIYDSGGNSEDVVVNGVIGNTITCPPLQNNHADGVFISGMPTEIPQATGMIAANLIARGTDGQVLTGDEQYKQQYENDSVITTDIKTLLMRHQINR